MRGNDECVSECPSEFGFVNTTNPEEGIKFCSLLCKGEKKFFDGKGDCLENCPSPFKHEYHGTSLLCLNPCANQEGKILNIDGTCVDKCPEGTEETE